MYTVNNQVDEPNSSIASTVCSSTPSGVCTLRAAVMAANASPGPDMIVIPVGIFRLTIAGTDDTAQLGDLDITDDVTISGMGAGTSIVDGSLLSPGDRLFDIRPGTQATISGVTLRNTSGAVEGGAIRVGDASAQFGDATLHLSACSFENNHPTTPTRGGSILVATTGSVLTASSCSFTGGQASFGGAIDNRGTLTITSCSFTSNSVDTAGGAIEDESGTTQITDSTFSMNGSFNGGAVDNPGANMTITGGTFSSNSGGQGAAVLNNAVITITGTVFDSNNSHDATGGGLLNQPGATATLTRTTFTNNSAHFYGGGIYNAGTLSLVDSLIQMNHDSLDGGGGFVQDGGTATIRGSAIVGNTGPVGGGIYIDVGTLHLTNSTVSGNSSSGTGAGIYNHGPAGTSVTLSNVTVAYNLAGTLFTVGGILNDNGGSFTVTDSLLAWNAYQGLSLPVYITDCSGTINSGGYNVVRVGCGFASATGDQVGSFDFPLDPKIDTLKMNGGYTPTHALLSGSPAIDAGDNTAGGCKDELGATLSSDQRGSKRPLPIGGRCDTGAFELGPSGDVNGDGLVNVTDVFYLINFLFAGGPIPLGRGDVNGDNVIDVADVFYLINFLFAGGPAPK
jgi:predicted outer membrane repeat protein